MSKGPIYAYCNAGCKWETVHKSEFDEFKEQVVANRNLTVFDEKTNFSQVLYRYFDNDEMVSLVGTAYCVGDYDTATGQVPAEMKFVCFEQSYMEPPIYFKGIYNDSYNNTNVTNPTVSYSYTLNFVITQRIDPEDNGYKIVTLSTVPDNMKYSDNAESVLTARVVVGQTWSLQIQHKGAPIAIELREVGKSKLTDDVSVENEATISQYVDNKIAEVANLHVKYAYDKYGYGMNVERLDGYNYMGIHIGERASADPADYTWVELVSAGGSEGGSSPVMIKFDNRNAFPEEGLDDVFYIDSATSGVYYWDGSEYKQVGASGAEDGQLTQRVSDLEKNKQDKLTHNSEIDIKRGRVSEVANDDMAIVNKVHLDTELMKKANKSEVPTKTSQLTNDSGFLTQHQDISGKADKTAVEALETEIGNINQGVAAHGESIEGLNLNKADKTEIQPAVNDALAIAKASGDFKGDKGDKGDTGPEGPQGPAGANGTNGTSAGFGTPTATVDANVGTPSVTVTASGSDNAKVFNFTFKNLKGAKGDKGDTGATGATGATGSQGPKGDKGDKGDTGAQGPAYTLTSSDLQTIVNAVIAALPKYTGEVA